MRLSKNYLFPIGILSGTIIGAGIFALPYAIDKIGYLAGAVYLFIFAFVFWKIHLMYADIILESGGQELFASRAQKLIGRWAFFPSLVIVVGGMLLMLAVYLVLAARFGHLVFSSADSYTMSLIFWIIGSAFVFINLGDLAWGELVVTLGIVAIIGLVFWGGLEKLLGAHQGLFLSKKAFDINPRNFLLPFGPLLFSLAGRAALPAVVSYVQRAGEPLWSLRKIILWGTAIPAAVYFLFAMGIFGLSPVVSEDSISGITEAPFFMLLLLGILGLISILSTYVVIGRSIKNMLEGDLGLSSFISSFIVIIFPFSLYIWGPDGFFGLVSLVGGVFLALENILIIFMWRGLLRRGLSHPLSGSNGLFAVNLIFLVLTFGFLYEVVKIL